MSHEQPRRPQKQGDEGWTQEGQPIKYGDVFDVSGDLASRPVAPLDAEMIQSSEQTVLGQTPAGGAAAIMSSAAAWNERAGLVGHRTAKDIAAGEGVTVTETDVPGGRVVTEQGETRTEQDAITIGGALEAAGQSAGYKPVSRSDAAAIQAAEHMATGSNITIPGGLAAAAQSAAAYNEETLRNEDKIKLSQVLSVK